MNKKLVYIKNLILLFYSAELFLCVPQSFGQSPQVGGSVQHTKTTHQVINRFTVEEPNLDSIENRLAGEYYSKMKGQEKIDLADYGIEKDSPVYSQLQVRINTALLQDQNSFRSGQAQTSYRSIFLSDWKLNPADGKLNPDVKGAFIHGWNRRAGKYAGLMSRFEERRDPTVVKAASVPQNPSTLRHAYSGPTIGVSANKASEVMHRTQSTPSSSFSVNPAVSLNEDEESAKKKQVLDDMEAELSRKYKKTLLDNFKQNKDTKIELKFLQDNYGENGISTIRSVYRQLERDINEALSKDLKYYRNNYKGETGFYDIFIEEGRLTPAVKDALRHGVYRLLGEYAGLRPLDKSHRDATSGLKTLVESVSYVGKDVARTLSPAQQSCIVQPPSPSAEMDCDGSESMAQELFEAWQAHSQIYINELNLREKSRKDVGPVKTGVLHQLDKLNQKGIFDWNRQCLRTVGSPVGIVAKERGRKYSDDKKYVPLVDEGKMDVPFAPDPQAVGEFVQTVADAEGWSGKLIAVSGKVAEKGAGAWRYCLKRNLQKSNSREIYSKDVLRKLQKKLGDQSQNVDYLNSLTSFLQHNLCRSLFEEDHSSGGVNACPSKNSSFAESQSGSIDLGKWLIYEGGLECYFANSLGESDL
jgi:hypothetical protein